MLLEALDIFWIAFFPREPQRSREREWTYDPYHTYQRIEMEYESNSSKRGKRKVEKKIKKIKSKCIEFYITFSIPELLRKYYHYHLLDQNKFSQKRDQ